MTLFFLGIACGWTRVLRCSEAWISALWRLYMEKMARIILSRCITYLWCYSIYKHYTMTVSKVAQRTLRSAKSPSSTECDVPAWHSVMLCQTCFVCVYAHWHLSLWFSQNMRTKWLWGRVCVGLASLMGRLAVWIESGAEVQSNSAVKTVKWNSGAKSLPTLMWWYFFYLILCNRFCVICESWL